MDAPDPRFTLANERTALAWIRTGLAFVAAGLGAATAAHLLELGALFGVSGVGAVALGAVVTAASARRWQRVQTDLDAGREVRPTRLVPATAAGVVLVAVLAAVLALIQLVG
jgi:putative membrane protein